MNLLLSSAHYWSSVKQPISSMTIIKLFGRDSGIPGNPLPQVKWGQRYFSFCQTVWKRGGVLLSELHPTADTSRYKHSVAWYCSLLYNIRYSVRGSVCDSQSININSFAQDAIITLYRYTENDVTSCVGKKQLFAKRHRCLPTFYSRDWAAVDTASSVSTVHGVSIVSC